MSEWKKVKLGEGIDVLSGFAFKSKDFADSGIPVVKIKNINPPYVTLDDVTYVPVNVANANPKYILHKGDVLIAMTGSHINQIASVVGRVGRVVYDAPSVLNQRVGKIVVTDQHSFDYLFIYYFLSQYSTKVKLANIAGGAANQANISPSDIKNLDIMLPPLRAQHTISKILYGYDSLISNYQRQIKLLEEAAQRLYKEWFVDLHFPGYENTKIVDGVPEGWRRNAKLSSIADIIMGQSPKSEFYNDKKIGLPFHQGVGSYGDRFVVNNTYSSQYTRIAEKNSILFSVRAPVGRININKEKIAIGRGLASIKEKNGYQSFLFYLLKHMFFRDNIIGNGAIFASITREQLYDLNVMFPPLKLVRGFNDKAKIIDARIFNIDSQLRLLTEARDRLLPKLMSGEIEV